MRLKEGGQKGKSLLERLQRPGRATKKLEAEVVAALRTVFDPEIPVNIYDLGLIYGLELTDDGTVNIRMTLTAPGCPVAETFPATVANAVLQVDGVNTVDVELVWEPPWSQDLMHEAARLDLGMW